VDGCQAGDLFIKRYFKKIQLSFHKIKKFITISTIKTFGDVFTYRYVILGVVTYRYGILGDITYQYGILSVFTYRPVRYPERCYLPLKYPEHYYSHII